LVCIQITLILTLCPAGPHTTALLSGGVTCYSAHHHTNTAALFQQSVEILWGGRDAAQPGDELAPHWEPKVHACCQTVDLGFWAHHLVVAVCIMQTYSCAMLLQHHRQSRGGKQSLNDISCCSAWKVSTLPLHSHGHQLLISSISSSSAFLNIGC